jgi:exosortase
MTAPTDNPVTSRKSARTGLLLAGLGFILALAPLLRVFFCELWARSAYQFFPMALGAAGMLAWRAWRELDGQFTPGSRRGMNLLVGVTVMVGVAGNILWSPWLGMLALLLVLATLVWSLGGRRAVTTFGPALLMLACILPPPLGGDMDLTLWLRSVSVKTSSGLLDLLQIVHVLHGNTILLPGKALLVEEACSGINSVVLCGAFCLFWTFWQRQSLIRLLILLPATCSFVVLGNVLRITVGAALNYYQQVDLLTGRPHEVFGLVLLLVYCGLILSLDQLLTFLAHPAKRSAESARISIGVSPLPAIPSAPGKPVQAQLLGFKLAGWFVGVVGIGALATRLIFSGNQANNTLPIAVVPRDIKLSLPATVGDWQRGDTNSGTLKLTETLGVRSILWRFQRGEIEAVVAVDYPLAGFHNVKICYQNNGWLVKAEDAISSRQNDVDLHAFSLILERSPGYAVVCYSVVNEQGQWLSPPVRNNILWERFFGASPADFQTGYRIQVLIGCYAPLSAATVGDAQELFLQVRQLLVQQLVAQFPQPSGGK